MKYTILLTALLVASPALATKYAPGRGPIIVHSAEDEIQVSRACAERWKLTDGQTVDMSEQIAAIICTVEEAQRAADGG